MAFCGYLVPTETGIGRFAILFFLINIVITFQTIIGITPSIMNDRYTYLASIGIFLLFALLLRQALIRWSPWKKGSRCFFWFAWGCWRQSASSDPRSGRTASACGTTYSSKYDRVAIAWINRGEARAALRDFPGREMILTGHWNVDPQKQPGLGQPGGGQNQNG